MFSFRTSIFNCLFSCFTIFAENDNVGAKSCVKLLSATLQSSSNCSMSDSHCCVKKVREHHPQHICLRWYFARLKTLCSLFRILCIGNSVVSCDNMWNSSMNCEIRIYMSLVTWKPVFGVCDQVQLKPACSATETSWSLEIAHKETRDIVLSKQRTAKVLIRLRGVLNYWLHLD